jgi:hypothetical protein
MTTVFDIESVALPASELARVMPEFKAPGNYKKPEAIEAYLAEARAEWRDRAALSAISGRVLAIGIQYGPETRVWGVDSEADEADTLTLFWDKWRDSAAKDGAGRWVGFCCKSFDLPFLIQRSWINSVSIPFGVMEGRYWSERIVDLQERWLRYGRDSKGCSLDAVAKALKVGAKNGSGKDFAALWNTDRDAAIGYLKNDLSLTAAVAIRLGL